MPFPWSWFICICIFPSLSLPLLRTQCWQDEKWRNKICIKTEKYDLHEHGSPKQMPWVHLWHEEPFRRPNTETLPFKRQIAKLNVFKIFFYSLALLPLKVLWCYWWYWCRGLSLLMSGASKQADSDKIDRCHKSTLTLLWAKTITFLQTPLWVVPCSMTGFSVWVHPAGSLCDPPLVPATPGEPPVHIVTKTGHKKTPSVDDGFCTFRWKHQDCKIIHIWLNWIADKQRDEEEKKRSVFGPFQSRILRNSSISCLPINPGRIPARQFQDVGDGEPENQLDDARWENPDGWGGLGGR